MIQQLKKLYFSKKEIINYLFFGVCTTAVNWVTYSLLVKLLSFNINTANIISWIVAVAFAYVTNKIWVFESRSWEPSFVLKEALSFTGSRLLSGVFEIGLLPILVACGLNQTLFGVEGFVAKIIISVIVVILNYIFSRFFVFKNGSDGVLSKIKAFDNKSQRNKRIIYYTCYTLAFIITGLLVFYAFWSRGRSFVWDSDGLEQHFNSLVYFGRYMRSIIYELFETGRLVIPLWDSTIGFGSDILTTLHYYAIGDPLNLLSVFVPGAFTVYLYTALIILRMFLSGATFSMFCNKLGLSRLGSLCGALVYTFSGFALVALRHCYFINPILYLPLILLGIEKIFRKEKPYLFIIMIFISALSSFYFFYMLSILMFIYAVFRFFHFYKEHYIVNIFKNLGSFIVYYLIGLLMACPIFLPNIAGFFSTARSDAKTIIDVFYRGAYYPMFPQSFITTETPGYWTYIGVAVVALLAIFLLFIKRKKHTDLKLGFLLLTVFLLIPYIGHVFNGFAYMNNRWVFGYTFIIALILAVMLPSLFTLTKRQLGFLTIFTIAYIVVCLFNFDNLSYNFFVSAGLLVLSLVLPFWAHISKQNGTVKTSMKVLITSLTMISICANALYLYSAVPGGGDYASDFYKASQAFPLMADTSLRTVKKIDDDSFYRVEQNKNTVTNRNSALVNRINATSYYFSLGNGYIFNYMDELNSLNNIDAVYYGLDGRTMQLTLAAGKYFVIKSDQKQYLPYGYTEKAATYQVGQKPVQKNVSVLEGNNTSYTAYESSNTLGLCYAYSSYIPKSEYLNLTPTQRQQAMLQSVVLDQSTLPKGTPVYNDKELDFTISYTDGITIENGVITVTDKSASITLNFEGVPYCETYLQMSNLSFEGIHPLEKYTDEDLENMEDYERKELINKNKYWTEPTNATISVECEDVEKSAIISNPYHEWYRGRNDFLFNLCYSEDAKSSIKISFSKTGRYSYDDISVIVQPMDNVDEQITNLNYEIPEGLNLSTNGFTGTFNFSQDKFLCFSIPYSSGWSAYVDGQEVELMQANSMYMGIMLTPGEHTVELKYMTPGLPIGIIMSIVGLFLFICVIILNVYRKKKIGT